MTKISVVTPAFNAAEHIGRTIESVRAQTFDNWEHIIVDDGSTDRTRDIVAEYTDPRLKYVYQDNQGPSVARNHAMKISSGEFVTFLDAGDWWEDTCLEVLLNGAESKRPDRVIVHGDWAFADADGHVGQLRSSAFTRGEGLNSLLLFNPCLLNAILVPRQIIMSFGGFRPLATLEDWALLIGLAHAGYRYIHVPRLVAYYHWQPNSRSKNIDRRKKGRVEVLNAIWPLIDQSDPLQGIKELSYATSYIEACVSRFGQGDAALALQEFDTAVRHHRPIIASIDTYYRIAYAELSAYEGADEALHVNLDEAAARRRLELVQHHIRTNYSAAEARSAKRAIFTALGLASYNEHRHSAARSYLWKAARTDPTALVDLKVSMTLAKSFLPVGSLEYARKWRRGS